MGHDGCLLGIGDTVLEMVGDGGGGASAREVLESIVGVVSLSCDVRRRFRGRNVVELVTEEGAAFMATEGPPGLVFEGLA